MKRRKNAPCYGCTDRYPGCQDPVKCGKWAEYAAERNAEQKVYLDAAKNNEDFRNVRKGARKRRRYKHA